MPSHNKPEKRSFAVYRSSAGGERGELIVNAHGRQWNKVAKKWAFHNLPGNTKKAWVRVELRKPGRGENPAKLYHLSRDFVPASESYRAIAQARGYKNVDRMPMVTIEGKAETLVANTRKAPKRSSKSKTPKKKSTTPKKKSSKPKKKSSKPKKKSTTPKKKSSKPKKKSTTPKKKSSKPKKKSTTPKRTTRSQSPKRKSTTPKKRSTKK